MINFINLIGHTSFLSNGSLEKKKKLSYHLKQDKCVKRPKQKGFSEFYFYIYFMVYMSFIVQIMF